jgi:hypothetical protein
LCKALTASSTVQHITVARPFARRPVRAALSSQSCRNFQPTRLSSDD